jgi:low affinity Fe/Cu permease
MNMNWLETCSSTATRFVSSSWGMLTGILVFAYWLLAGPLIGWGNAWFYFDAIASAAAFFLLFLLQRSQTKDSMALHLKINELLAALNKASPGLINVEDLGEDEITQMHDDFKKLQNGDTASHSIDEISKSHRKGKKRQDPRQAH